MWLSGSVPCFYLVYTLVGEPWRVYTVIVSFKDKSWGSALQ
jgi:hypothetical protein